MFERLFGDKFSRFRLGQVIFATAVSFGLFAGDIIRIVLGVLALFCLTKENFKFNWTRGQKITGCILALFCAWMVIIPVIFGENPLPVRLRDAVRPVELTLWICATLLFAKDDFFVHNLKNFSITACFLYSLTALHWCFETHFALEFYKWPILGAAYAVAAPMAGISVWIVYALLTADTTANKIFCFVALLLSFILTILPCFTEFWVAMFVGLPVMFILLFVADRKKCLAYSFCLCLVFIIFGCALYRGMTHNPNLRGSIERELNQLHIINNTGDFDPVRFTSKRWLIWKQGIKVIQQKPLLGHGREIQIEYCDKEYTCNMHNSFFQASYEAGVPLALIFGLLLAAIFALAVRSHFKAGKLTPLPFVTITVLMQFLTVSMADNLYLTDRSTLIFYWSIYMTMLGLYNKDWNKFCIM